MELLALFVFKLTLMDETAVFGCVYISGNHVANFFFTIKNFFHFLWAPIICVLFRISQTFLLALLSLLLS